MFSSRARVTLSVHVPLGPSAFLDSSEETEDIVPPSLHGTSIIRRITIPVLWMQSTSVVGGILGLVQ